MNALWGVALASLCVATAVQSTRLQKTSEELRDLRRSATRSAQERFAYRASVLENVNDALTTSPELRNRGDSAGDVLYMSASTKCGACRTALETLRDRGSTLPLRVAAINESPSLLRDWLADIGIEAVVVDDSAETAMLRRLPATVTPVFLELRGGEPVHVQIGQPRAAWIGRSPSPLSPNPQEGSLR